jgi:hypothetical protein
LLTLSFILLSIESDSESESAEYPEEFSEFCFFFFFLYYDEEDEELPFLFLISF